MVIQFSETEIKMRQLKRKSKVLLNKIGELELEQKKIKSEISEFLKEKGK